MAIAIATMAMLNAKCLSINSSKNINPNKPFTKPISLLSMQDLRKGLTISKPAENTALVGTAIAGAIFSTLSSCDPALAAQQIAEIAADGDNRGLALLLPIILAIAWVLFNILQPALNQLDRMRETKGVIIGLGLGGLAASGFMSAPEASASEIAMIADATNDNRGQLLLFVVAPALLWVLYNILQPALNQLNRMRVGQEVEALRRIGVADSVGIDLVPFPPLVIKGDFHHQPFDDETFDFEFSNVFDHALYPDKFVAEIERTLKPGGICVLHVAISRRADKYSANDLFNTKPLVEMFKKSEVVHVRKVDGFGLDTEMVFRKKKMNGEKVIQRS
ncbi:hypothetical protein GH714_024824 [Hevea brasiliensis]|uniref:Methyltransferase type 11 domain-containing protein n=1 Tax=Hevea brasiliensis TaxID=3981 RepID=A0A6A6M091_HEVBR|nr:hypothetical protein GH714_024824 [Hevea brasiliensis]